MRGHSTPESLPRYHIRPQRGWLNDPNGMVRHGGRWHVFYQHNPARARHGGIHWGHVSSPDLVRWSEHPVAFGPEPGGPDSAGCWSGAFLLDTGTPSVAYSGLVSGPELSTVCVRDALDPDLDTWSSPRVVAEQPTGLGLAAMRDPYPFAWGGRRFALVGAGTTDGTPALLLFDRDDPDRWRCEGVWFDGTDPVAARVAPANVWECPQLVRVGDAWVLVLSLWQDEVLAGVVHLVGDLHGEPGNVPRFVAVDGGPLDAGPDFYAPQVVPDGDGDPLMFGWVKQADAPDDAPQDAVAGCLTLPRRLRLRGTRAEVAADPGLEALVGPLADPDRLPALPRRARLTVDGDGDLTLLPRTPGFGDAVTVAALGRGSTVWLDGEVVEAYRPGGVPSTVRLPGCADWALAPGTGGLRLRVQEVRVPVAGAAGGSARGDGVQGGA